MHFGSTLRLLRIDADVGLRELARRIGVSSAYLSRVENGHDPAPTVDRLAAIAEVLGLSRSVLLELAGQAGPAVTGYLHRVPAAHSFVLELARRDLGPAQLARLKAILDAEFPSESVKPPLRFSELLSESRVLLGLACTDFEDLVSSAVARLPPIPACSPPELLHRVLAREATAPSFLGGGFVVPHVVLPGAKTTAVFSLLARPLALATPDAEPVHFSALIVNGAKGAAHLELLSRVARLAASGIGVELKRARTPARVLSLVRDLESTW